MNSDVFAVDLVMLPIGLGAITVGLWHFFREVSPRTWPQVVGTIVSSKSERQSTGHTGRYQFVPLVEFEFNYNGHTFRSSLRNANNYASGRREAADAIVARYPDGSSVRVFVNRQNPTKSVLEHGTTPVSWICIGLGIMLTTVSLLFIK